MEIVERFSNCGSAPIRLDARGCSALNVLHLEGPIAGDLDASGFTTARIGCGSASADQAARVVPPHGFVEKRYVWNGTILPACDETGCAPSERAPSGRYIVGVRLDALDGDDAWESTSEVRLAAWTESHGSWSEFHPFWTVGAGDFSWASAPGSVRAAHVPDGWVFATDGKTYLYADPSRLDHDPAAEAPCRAQGPPSAGTWVLVGATSCAWAPYPSMRCLPDPAANPCRAAMGLSG
jgi:hypothetical protein